MTEFMVGDLVMVKGAAPAMVVYIPPEGERMRDPRLTVSFNLRQPYWYACAKFGASLLRKLSPLECLALQKTDADV